MNREHVTFFRKIDVANAIQHVFVRDLTLSASIGVHAHEHGRMQPIRINVDLTTINEVYHNDNIANVVCYATVVNEIKALLSSNHFNLVETLAEKIAARCLVDPRVIIARIRVEKLTAILEATSVGVEIERDQ